jgi:hypothetical protein
MNPIATPPPPVPLAAPGAGLPLPELLAARLMFSWHRWRMSRAAAAADIRAERDALRALVSPLDPELGARQVLIPRLRGMEDSSRYWSAYMTLEHLRIVNQVTAGLIVQLLHGRTPGRTASTADVKPASGIGPDVIAAMEESCAAIARAADSASTLRTKARYAHPWFGPLDAAGWHALTGFHMRLHRKQVASILAHLPGAT